MISLIICSRQPDIPQLLKDNIAETIGVEYELVVIDNSKNQFSIFQAYNEGVRRAKYPLLCFMHEDILYHTLNWGEKVVEHFQDEKVGLIGVVGGHYMPKCPASWWSTECKSGIFIQGDYRNKVYTPIKYNWENYRTNFESSLSVSAVDGLWFCLPKEVFYKSKIKFDDISFAGFHCYDSDICMQVLNVDLEVKVVFDILIEHFSIGKHDKELIKQKVIFFNKWNKFLPIIRGVKLTNIEINDRLIFVENMNSLIIDELYSRSEMERILSSKAYRLGKFILKPFSFVRHKILNL